MTAYCDCASELLHLDAAREVERLERAIRDIIFVQCRRKGAVVGVSGGIDSSVVVALCARALGPERVIALFTPEADSSGDSLRLGLQVCEWLGIKWFKEDITPILQAAGCYQRRDDAIRRVMPEFGAGYRSKIVFPNLVESDRYAVFSLVVRAPDGSTTQLRLPLQAYLGIVAATNFKQRTRKMIEYHYADLHNFAVAGTPNRLEYDQGFFVKNGDGAADLNPIAHLYKSQVYQLAAYLGVPQEIQSRPPTTDTYSLEQSQEEFFFSMPLEKLDLCLYGKDHELPSSEIAVAAGLTAEQVERVYTMIEARRKSTRYLHLAPVLAQELP
ncbi:MAG: NAD(+) synthase [Acidobacteriales bacterium]|nr:NAD(+) synthase [Terriglobales bacterium]